MSGDARDASYDLGKSVTFTMGMDHWGHRKVGSLGQWRTRKGRKKERNFRSFNLEGCPANSCSPTCSAKVGEAIAGQSWVQWIMEYWTLVSVFRSSRLCQGLQGCQIPCRPQAKAWQALGPILRACLDPEPRPISHVSVQTSSKRQDAQKVIGHPLGLL